MNLIPSFGSGSSGRFSWLAHLITYPRNRAQRRMESSSRERSARAENKNGKGKRSRYSHHEEDPVDNGDPANDGEALYPRNAFANASPRRKRMMLTHNDSVIRRRQRASENSLVAYVEQTAAARAERDHARAVKRLRASIQSLVAEDAARRGGSLPAAPPSQREATNATPLQRLMASARRIGLVDRRADGSTDPDHQADGKTEPEGGNEPRPRRWSPADNGEQDLAERLRQIARERGAGTPDDDDEDDGDGNTAHGRYNNLF